MRWSVVHMREFMSTVNVSRGLGAADPLRVALDEGIDLLSFRPLGVKGYWSILF